MTSARDLAALGDRLRGAGLVSRTLATWAGTDRLSALPPRLADLAARAPVPAAAALALFVAGAEVAIDRVYAHLPLERLLAAGLLERSGDRVRAPVAVLPIGEALLVCDRADAADDPALVCWPDDSSLHLASALSAGRRARWLDLGCGSAVAPLARPGLAAAITGIDINPRAVAHARLGAALSGIEHLVIADGDLGAAAGPAELVTCNAPIPGADDAAVWRGTTPAFFARLWPAARTALAAGGEVVIHTVLAAIPEDLTGERVIVVYTPPGARAFAVLWWRPDAPARHVVRVRELTDARPHLDASDRDAALEGALAPLDG